MIAARSYTSPLRAEQAAATRDRVVDAAIDLLQEADPGAFGMQDVADRAGVALRTVYRAFPTKDDLLVGVLDAIKERFAEIAGAPPTTRDEFDASVTDAVRAVYELEPLYRALFATIAGRATHQSGAGSASAGIRVGLRRRARWAPRGPGSPDRLGAASGHLGPHGAMAQGLRRARRRRRERGDQMGDLGPRRRGAAGGAMTVEWTAPAGGVLGARDAARAGRSAPHLPGPARLACSVTASPAPRPGTACPSITSTSAS